MLEVLSHGPEHVGDADGFVNGGFVVRYEKDIGEEVGDVCERVANEHAAGKAGRRVFIGDGGADAFAPTTGGGLQL